MSAVGLPMGDQEGSTGSGQNSAEEVAALLKEHAAVLGRVAMALLGDAQRVEQVLEEVARNAGTPSKKPPADAKPLTWLLGLLRAASATQLSKLPLRGHTKTGPGFEPPPPTTERIGAGVAIPARASLAALKPTEREAVVLALVGGLDASEVAIACNVDLGTAKTRIARGLEQLLSAK
jgi:DNA-directed RNA polymerase specialized sigma24 family protein